MEKSNKHRILILGASGFLGNAIYNQLKRYYSTFGTYNTTTKFSKNKHFFAYNHEEDTLDILLENLKPSIIISALRGNFTSQIIAHQFIYSYLKNNSCKVIFLSSANVFDAYSKFPSYETDKTLSTSVYGHFKIKIENLFMQLPQHKWSILRIPMVFGLHAPRILELKDTIEKNKAVEVFPNLIINVTSYKKLTQQIHYICNRNKHGIFHLGSTNVLHHDDFIKEITTALLYEKATYKRVYTTNEERWLAILPKYNMLPKHLQITSAQVVEELCV